MRRASARKRVCCELLLVLRDMCVGPEEGPKTQFRYIVGPEEGPKSIYIYIYILRDLERGVP